MFAYRTQDSSPTQLREPDSDPSAGLVEEPGLHPADAADELLAVLHRIGRLETHAAALLAQVNDRDRWRQRGYTSATAFLKHRAAMTGGRALRLVTRSNALAAMPLAREALEAGDLSTDQADILCDAYNFNDEAYLAEEELLVAITRQLPFVDELRRLVDFWRLRVDPAASEWDEEALRGKRGISVRRDRGVGRAYACFSDEETDLLLKALDPGPPPPEDRRSLRQRRADRLMEIIAGSMDRPQLIINVDAQSVFDAAHRAPGTTSAPGSPAADRPPAAPVLRGETEFGTVLMPATLERLACDATVCRIVFGPGSQVLDSGRKARLFTDPQRRAVVARDRHCRFPGCDRPPQWSDVHHLVHWLRGGITSVANGILLCRFHHTLVHEAGWLLVGSPAEVTVYDDAGVFFGTSTPSLNPARAP